MDSKSVVRHGWCGVVLSAVLAAVPAAAQEGGEQDAAMAEMMKAWQAYAAVGAPHEALQRREGAWDVTVKFWYAPGAEPQVSKGSSTVEPIMGGRYMLERFSSSMPDGSAFEGMGLVAYDNMKGRFQAMWIDSMSTGFMTAESVSHSDDFSRITYRGETPDPAAGRYKEQRSVESWRGGDTRVLEAFEAGADGEDHKVMEITYSRR